MAVPVGITVPKMLREEKFVQIEALSNTNLHFHFSCHRNLEPPFAAYFTVLSTRVVAQRVKRERWMGTGDQAVGEDELLVAARCHANFAENVPFALLLASIVELNGGNRKILNGSLAALFLLRILHVEMGLMGPNSMSNGRPIGYFGTLSFLAGMGGYAAYLVKGYWGF